MSEITSEAALRAHVEGMRQEDRRKLRPSVIRRAVQDGLADGVICRDPKAMSEGESGTFLRVAGGGHALNGRRGKDLLTVAAKASARTGKTFVVGTHGDCGVVHFGGAVSREDAAKADAALARRVGDLNRKFGSQLVYQQTSPYGAAGPFKR